MRAKLIAVLACVAIAVIIGASYVALRFLLPVGQPPGQPPAIQPPGQPHIEAEGVVHSVKDGDTIVVTLTWLDGPRGDIATNVREEIRFAGGVDAPEFGELGGAEAKRRVEELCTYGTEVGLDLDDQAHLNSGIPYRDRYRRIAAVVYVNVGGRWVNVNADILRWGRQAYPGYDWLKYAWMSSEFNPHEWLGANYPYVRG